ncbi:hypothetical protein MA16_Dca026533 [Dendrobium catenatum]|uniref:Uncharacterized protein n=1 Tax=Dendrobium catenatum TaxID=906689 RepID=A0A2I0WWV3_9ASPA|nr:hypothetical protein MA16_Dca026533 [Dendrobium catenatum]
MKVERLTNDEVKSHLQKYRLHTTRPSTQIHSSSYINPQIPPQLVLVGGIWVPPPDYRVMVTAAEQSSAAFNGTYSSVPSMALESGLSQQKQDKQQKQLNNLPSKPSQSFEDDTNLAHELATKSDSCTLSSTSQTTTLPLLLDFPRGIQTEASTFSETLEDLYVLDLNYVRSILHVVLSYQMK